MGDVSRGEGRTVLFVSHNLSSIAELCKKSILMSKGEVIKFDDTSEVISEYLSVEPSKVIEQYYQDCPINILRVIIRDINDKKISNFNMDDKFSIFLELKQIEKIEYIIGLQFINSLGVSVCHFMSLDENIIYQNNESIKIDIDGLSLYPDIYNLNIFICDKKDSILWGVVKVNGAFTVTQENDKIKRNLKVSQGIIFPKFKFHI
jgi:lipopolysaccharide transport system ATP-binding protein